MATLSPLKAIERVNFPNDRLYTLNAILEELAIAERHCRDESYKSCTCLGEKHLYLLAGLASEGYGFAESLDEKEFMRQLQVRARKFNADLKGMKFKSSKDYDVLRAWLREQRHRLEERNWKGIEYEEKEVPDSVIRLVEDLEGMGFERENPLSLPELEEEMTTKMVHYLCDKHNIPYPEIKFVDACNPMLPNAAHIQKDQMTPEGIKPRPELDILVFCRGGATAYAISHEFSHLKDHYDGKIVANERKAHEFASKITRNHLYTPLDGSNIHIEATQNNLTGKSMSLKMTKEQSDKGLTVVAGLTAAKLVSEYDPQITAALGPLGTMIGKIGVGAIAAWYGLTRVRGTVGDILLFAGSELALNEVFKQFALGGVTARAPAVVPGGPVAMPLTPGRAEIYPGASSTIGAAAPFMRTFTTPTRLTAGYPQVAQADGKFIQIRV